MSPGKTALTRLIPAVSRRILEGIERPKPKGSVACRSPSFYQRWHFNSPTCHK